MTMMMLRREIRTGKKTGRFDEEPFARAFGKKEKQRNAHTRTRRVRSEEAR